MADVAPERLRRGGDADERRRDVVHARLREEVLVLVVHEEADVAGGDEELRVRAVVRAAAQGPEKKIGAARLEVRDPIRVRRPVDAREDVAHVLAAVLRAQHVRRVQRPVRRRVLLAHMVWVFPLVVHVSVLRVDGAEELLFAVSVVAHALDDLAVPDHALLENARDGSLLSHFGNNARG